eukprot:jgi/Mesvir1/3212/Mv16364-RA.1
MFSQVVNTKSPFQTTSLVTQTPHSDEDPGWRWPVADQAPLGAPSFPPDAGDMGNGPQQQTACAPNLAVSPGCRGGTHTARALALVSALVPAQVTEPQGKASEDAALADKVERVIAADGELRSTKTGGKRGRGDLPPAADPLLASGAPNPKRASLSGDVTPLAPPSSPCDEDDMANWQQQNTTITPSNQSARSLGFIGEASAYVSSSIDKIWQLQPPAVNRSNNGLRGNLT